MERGLRYDEAVGQISAYGHHSKRVVAGNGKSRYLPSFYKEERSSTGSSFASRASASGPGEASGALAEVRRLPPDALGAEDTGLSNGKAYFYAVRSLDTLGQMSPPSPEVTATPVAAPAPTQVPWLTAQGGDARVVLSWGASSRASFSANAPPMPPPPPVTMATLPSTFMTGSSSRERVR